MKKIIFIFIVLFIGMSFLFTDSAYLWFIGIAMLTYAVKRVKKNPQMMKFLDE